AFEFKPYDKATNAIANVIKVNAKTLNINTLAGGGDTVSAIKIHMLKMDSIIFQMQEGLF
ncbi:MAG: phosphoglycerate kinase, partial [Pelagibacterales bacterium]|nr:phosphoglycerate kinase [Pelagibacterales bacterium]